MKKILKILTIGILFINCSDNNNVNNHEYPKKETLKIIDAYQELLLKQKGTKCGEWGGDTKEIRIYKSEHKGNVYADFKETIINCNDPYSGQPKIIEKKAIRLNDSELNLAQESIYELVNYKLTTERKIPHSGIVNSVISRDSTLLIIDYPSFNWPKFKELIKQIEN